MKSSGMLRWLPNYSGSIAVSIIFFVVATLACNSKSSAPNESHKHECDRLENLTSTDVIKIITKLLRNVFHTKRGDYESSITRLQRKFNDLTVTKCITIDFDRRYLCTVDVDIRDNRRVSDLRGNALVNISVSKRIILYVFIIVLG